MSDVIYIAELGAGSTSSEPFEACLDLSGSEPRIVHLAGDRARFNTHRDEIFSKIGRFRPIAGVQEISVRTGEKYEVGPHPLQIGQYWPRIYRPGADDIPLMRADVEGSAIEQADILLGMLYEISQYIHPHCNNLTGYGHHTRNLLLLAATEFEAQCRGVVQENNYAKTGEFFTTKDYIQLLPILKLQDYGFALPYLPWLSIRPFAAWCRNCPTKSLAWYRAYNLTKHDREGSFDKAQLGYVIDAVVACVAMLYAQSALARSRKQPAHWTHRIGLKEKAKFRPRERYVGLEAGCRTNWQEVPYPWPSSTPATAGTP